MRKQPWMTSLSAVGLSLVAMVGGASAQQDTRHETSVHPPPSGPIIEMPEIASIPDRSPGFGLGAVSESSGNPQGQDTQTYPTPVDAVGHMVADSYGRLRFVFLLQLDYPNLTKQIHRWRDQQNDDRGRREPLPRRNIQQTNSLLNPSTRNLSRSRSRSRSQPPLLHPGPSLAGTALPPAPG